MTKSSVIFLCAVLVSLNTALAQQRPVDATDTAAIKKAVGKSITVTGKVTNVINGEVQAGEAGYMMFYLTDKVIGVVYDQHRKDVLGKHAADPTKLKGQSVTIRGQVHDNAGTYAILVTATGSFNVVEAAPPGVKPQPKPVQPKADANVISVEETDRLRQERGKTVTVRGKVVGAGQDTVEPARKYIMFSPNGLDKFFIIVMEENLAAVLKGVANDLGEIRGKAVDATGKIEFRNGNIPVMVLSKTDEMKLAGGAVPAPKANEPVAKKEEPKSTVKKPDPVPDEMKVKVGRSTIRFDSNPKLVRAVASMLKKPIQKKDVSQAGHSFNVFVPRNYKPGLPHGLLVQIDVQQSGSFPAGWDSILEKHHIIWMAPNGAGQSSSATKRVTLAVNGAVNVQKKYTIDPDRVYVLGYYDGSLPATAAATGFPSIFRGLVMTYPAFYRRISYKDGNIKYMLGESLVFNSSQRGIAVARKSTRVVMMGRESKMFKMVYDKGFKPDGFRYVLYDTGSTMTGFQGGLPGAKGLEKSIGFLDGPVSPTAERYYRKGKTYDRTKNTGMAFNAYATALMRGGKQKFTEDAKKRVDELYPKVVKELYAAEDAVLQTIEDRKFIQAAAQIRKLKSHGPIARPVMTKLEEQLASAKKGGTIARSPRLTKLDPPDAAGKDPLEQVDPRVKQAEEAEKAREEARKRREALAMKQFEDAKALMEKDLLEGYIALRGVAKKHRDSEAGIKATQLAEDTINDPKKRRILKPALEERDAAELLKIARNYVGLNKLDEAYDELRKLVKEYPRSKSAAEARGLMEQIRQRRGK